MTRHDERLLWDYAAKNLDLEDAKVLEHHLQECAQCSDRLEAMQLANKALTLAREAGPKVGWEAIDEKVGAVVERRLQRAARRTLWLKLCGSGALVAAAAMAAYAVFAPAPRSSTEPEVVAEAQPAPVDARVDRAEGLVRVGSEVSAMADGAHLKTGDVLRTNASGRAFVHLPDASHVRVGSGTQVTLTRADADDVALTLERGRIAVRAAHVDRKGFVVHASGLAVHVVGTVFSVANKPDGVEVAVSEGRVRLESSTHQLFVDAGQLVKVNTKTGRASRAALPNGLRDELAEVVSTDEAVTAVEAHTFAGRPGGPGSKATAPARGGPLPRLDAKESKSRQVALPPEALADVSTAKEEPKQAQSEPAVIVLEEPGNLWPSMAGGVLRGVPPKREEPELVVEGPVAQPQPAMVPAPMPLPSSVVNAPPAPKSAPAVPSEPDLEAEWAPLPKTAPAPAMVPPPPPTPPPAPVFEPMARAEPPVKSAAKLSEPEVVVTAPPPRGAAPLVVPAAPAGQKLRDDAGGAGKDLESVFLQRAGASLENGTCERFMLGLEEVAGDAHKNEHTERARLLRARCYDQQLRPRQSMMEYRKYLEEYPRGRFTAEAREALGN